MSKIGACAREIEWAGGKHVFDLSDPFVLGVIDGAMQAMPHALILRYEMQKPFGGQFGDTAAAVLKRFDNAVYSPRDVERIIELGLIGGGMEARTAIALVDKHVRGQPLQRNAVVAFTVVAALFVPQEA